MVRRGKKIDTPFSIIFFNISNLLHTQVNNFYFFYMLKIFKNKKEEKKKILFTEQSTRKIVFFLFFTLVSFLDITSKAKFKFRVYVSNFFFFFFPSSSPPPSLPRPLWSVHSVSLNNGNGVKCSRITLSTLHFW